MSVLCIRTVVTYDPKVCHWRFIFPKSDHWPNYRRKGYATNAFFWQNLVLFINRWRETTLDLTQSSAQLLTTSPELAELLKCRENERVGHGFWTFRVCYIFCPFFSTSIINKYLITYNIVQYYRFTTFFINY